MYKNKTVESLQAIPCFSSYQGDGIEKQTSQQIESFAKV